MTFLDTLRGWANNIRGAFGGAFSALRFWNIAPRFNDYADDTKKLNAVLNSPAVLKVFALQCDLFSLGRIHVEDKNGEHLPEDPALKLLSNPNPMQTGSQFLWDFMFWNMLGTDYCYCDSDVVDKVNNKLYFLEVQKIYFPLWLQQNCDKLIFSETKLKEYQDLQITYRYNDGTTTKIALKKILTAFDLTNGIGNWFKSPSRIDALYKIITNSEETLNTNNINIRFAGKFLVAGQADPMNVTQRPLGDDEKLSIEEKMNGDKNVHAVKSMVDIKRFIDNLAAQKLDDIYLHQYFLIGNMYNIPRDVLEAFASSTYENQEKATSRHISYTLQPKGNDFMCALGKRWGYDAEGKKVVMSWAHLPFMQVFEKEKASTEKEKSIAFANLLNCGVPLDEINKYLGTSFSKAEAGKVISSGTLKVVKQQKQSA